MKRSNALRSLKQTAVAALFGFTAFAGSAQAATIDFDRLSQGDFSVFTNGDSFSEKGFNFTVLGADGGLNGAGIAGSNDLTCTIINCPVGNNSGYYAGLNDGALGVVSQNPAGFKVRGLDFAFIAPTGGLIDFSVGKLVLTGHKMDGSLEQTTIDFQPQVNGVFQFSNWQAGNFGNTVFRDMTINACLFTMDGSCVSPAGNQAQFAVDNLNLAAVPEPSTYAMMGLGLLGLAAFARRRKQQA